MSLRSEAYVHPSPSIPPPRSALLALVSAGLAPLVVACVDDDLTEAPVSPAVETGLVADRDPLAYGTEEVFDSIVHPTRGRIVLTISATGPLQPNAGVALSVQGVAREPIDSGEVVLTLPTKALMDHVGEGRPDLPVKARWVLPSMAVGDTWSGTYTVPGEGAGYYRVMANAYTHGPDGGPYLFDDVVRQAWMFVSETDGQLTRWFEDSLFPEGVHPVAGPATAVGATPPMARRLLNLAADTLTKHFGHTRSRIKWNLRFKGSRSNYNGFFDKITLAWGMASHPRFHWIVAHEYGHALHHKALGGIWRAGNCSPHWLDSISSYECALKEGFADYAGTVGSGGYLENYFEGFTDKRRDRKPEIEGYVAALFLDLTDDREEEGDYTEYPGLYVAQVFKSCEVKGWRDRNKVSDIVWCLERLVTPGVHQLAFPGTDAPDSVREKATEPPDWHWRDIRHT